MWTLTQFDECGGLDRAHGGMHTFSTVGGLWIISKTSPPTRSLRPRLQAVPLVSDGSMGLKEKGVKENEREVLKEGAKGFHMSACGSM